MIGFYTGSVDCDDDDALRENFGQLEKPYETCKLQHSMVYATRAYFIAACINFVFVVITTAIFIYFAYNAPHNYYTPEQQPRRKGLFQRWQRTSLQRRSIFGTTLGALGNLVFTTAAFLSQTFYGYATCELYLWGVIMGFYTWIFALCWRAYRLYFLIRLNTLKARYASRHGGDQPRPHDSCDKDHNWLMKNTDCHAIRICRPLVAYVISFLVIVIICVLIETEHLRCEDKWSVCVLLSFVGFFVLIVGPTVLWRLKGSNDAHGIRNEIMIDEVAGIIFSVMTLIWYLKLNKPRHHFGPHYRYFAPRTWLIFFTTTAHVVSVVWPIWQLLPEWRKLRNQISGSSKATQEYIINHGLQQTPETLERLLRDPVAVKRLIRLGVQDFSSENVLAYKEYLRLADKVHSQSHGAAVERFTRRLHSSASTLVECASEPEDKSDDALLHMPIKSTYLLDEFVKFYDTYIRQGAPLQVNISFKARSELDSYFKQRSPHVMDDELAFGLITPWNQEPTPLSPVHFKEASTRLSWGDAAEFPPYAKSVSIPELELTLFMFEPARNELFWNIFASVFPKYVRTYQ